MLYMVCLFIIRHQKWAAEKYDTEGALQTYHCVCGQLALVVDTKLELLPMRRKDRSRVLDSKTVSISKFRSGKGYFAQFIPFKFKIQTIFQ